MRHAETIGKLLRPSRQVHCGTMTRQPPHFKLFPRNSMLNACPQRFRRRLFRRKPSGIALGEVLLAAAIGNLAWSKHLFQKTLAIALDGLRDPLDFHNVDSSANKHEQNFSSHKLAQPRPARYQPRPKSQKVTVKIQPSRSDQVSVSDTEELVDWDLRLTATCADDPQRILRFLTGAVLGCGGWVLSRSLPGSDTVEMSFEFARAVSVEIYTVLIAAGLELSRDAHISMTELCQCTKDLMASKAYDVARVRLLVLTVPIENKGSKNNQPSAERA